ncbi:MAG TPA: rubredoxin [Ferruginibacter sp.]|nr:rubredoxin [Ferruginibacter sp.]HMP20156.1 rubredoxin [Ferruginibacter sp.]
MKKSNTIKINFPGGIISPGDLYNILVAAGNNGITHVSFGLRQQLLIEAEGEAAKKLCAELEKLGNFFEYIHEGFPNIVSSYPAEEVFILNTWLSEGVYKDILDEIDYRPKLKINISDSNQSFTPMLTGNINWVASPDAQHFWYLFIRFPKTNIIYEWNQLVYTNDIARLSKTIEECIFSNSKNFVDNKAASGDALFTLIDTTGFILKPTEKRATLPDFNLPYYEGLNRYSNKYWLGVYRRDERFDTSFLKNICLLCLDTKIGQLCSTPWKTIIIKGIEEKDKLRWNHLLEQHNINMRHAANELNFQVEDNCYDGLQLKNYLIKKFNDDDLRTFGVCIGIKTRSKSEVFSSILVKRKPLLNIFGFRFCFAYDILCAQDFNPNERTGFVFSTFNFKFLLAEQLRRCITSFYQSREMLANKAKAAPVVKPKKETAAGHIIEYVPQCPNCLSIYDASTGDAENAVAAGTAFESLPATYCCPVCETGKAEFVRIDKSQLGLQTV